MPDHLPCLYCLDTFTEADLPGHLQAHRATDAGAMLLALEAIAAYQEVVAALLRELAVALLQAAEAEDRAKRWKRAASYSGRAENEDDQD